MESKARMHEWSKRSLGICKRESEIYHEHFNRPLDKVWDPLSLRHYACSTLEPGRVAAAKRLGAVAFSKLVKPWRILGVAAPWKCAAS